MTLRYYFNKVRYAARGLGYVFRHEVSFRLQLVVAVIVLGYSWWRHLPAAPWAVVLIAVASVLAAEIFNTVLERMLDLIEPRLSKHVGTLKDLLAAAVLVVSLAAATAIILVFVSTAS